MTDARGRKVDYTYSGLTGHLVTEHSDVTLGGTLNHWLTHSYQWDLSGRLISESDAVGRVTTYTYTEDDLVSRVVRKNVGNQNDATTRDVEIWRGTYDARSRLTSQTVGGLRTTNYVYDAEGRLVSSTLDPTGLKRTTTITRDADGRVIGTSLSDGTRTESAAYSVDAAGNPTSRTIANGAVPIITNLTRDANEAHHERHGLRRGRAKPGRGQP